MPSRQKGKKKPEGQSRVDRLTASPIRVVVLCAAVLMISASGGILIGKIFEPFESAPEIRSVSALAIPTAAVEPAARPDPLVPQSPFTYNDYPVTIPETASVESVIEVVSEPVSLATQADGLRDEMPAWKRYAALTPPLQGRPLIAIVIDDVGLSHRRVVALNDLPALLTMAFLPYAPGLQGKVELARQNGNEIMLHLPMEPTDHHVDPGPDALVTGLSREELKARTIRNLDSFKGYVGVNNHMGSRFTADGEAMAIVMDIMAARGLLFLDSKTTSASTGYRLAVERGMPSAKRDIFIDHVIDEKAILKQLAEVEATAERAGVAIAIGHPHPATIRVLQKWLPEAKKKGFLFVPISAVTALTFKG
ncbi:divergent polysaccharide deacetylase family protein [Sneathiella sp. HT1-7]|uniref:divergent polysaccharide deacetylase family protein n=1 Tax=Sneathiella sp. HT1-7 TaxID=2887192 RepID=UPI001D13C87A|nr:divergent polysaccharide deacetylase family protein [Sneathiella sp. HT1-7]MCC3306088.1 divergent polysaccharide deacetylase family protein [Sneathiella sp. HT1-7]